MKKVIVVGAGLAGVEASNYLLKKGVEVVLYEMRPQKFTPAHRTSLFAELVCSNTLGSIEMTSGAGLLKKEMEVLESLIIEAAYKTRVPAGSALAVDRELFSKYITRVLLDYPNLRLMNEEFVSIPKDEVVIIATGPLTSDTLSREIQRLVGVDYLYFYDAIAPIVDAETVDYTKGFWGSRYDKGGDDYFNCVMTEEEYRVFYDALIHAQKVPTKDFEKEIYFEGCMPIEALAERGYKTLLYGPMKPVGLIDPSTGKMPFAVVQLRKENLDGTLLSLVGFQTRMTYSEQKRVFRLIPALQNAEFVKLGSMHRNTYLQSNKVLMPYLNLRNYPNIFFAGQIIGVEGYIASAFSGIIAGINAYRYIMNKELVVPPEETLIGSLIRHITQKSARETLQPVAPVLGLINAGDLGRIKRDERKRLISSRSISSLYAWKENFF